MKKLMTLAMIGAASLTLAACTADGEADYTYEQQAPFADERTVGTVEPVAKAEPVFKKAQTK